MNYLFAPLSVTQRQRIFREIVDLIGDGSRLELFHDLGALSAKLARFGKPEILIVLAVGKEEMPEVISLRERIPETVFIIVLSDENPRTIARAISLKPRFVGVMNDDLNKIVPLVEKLVRRQACGG
jgi:hypothetical protein